METSLRPLLVASFAAVGAFFVACPEAFAAVLSVGPAKTYAAPCAAFAAAADGDTIEIDATGSYSGDVCAISKNNLTIKGIGGRAHIDAGGKNSGGKAIWVIQGSDTVVEDIELSGCTVPDGNGAGIRQEGRNLTVRRSYFHDNQNGILSDADAESVYLFENSEFANNGAGDGYTHNMYIGEIKRFTLIGSYSHNAKVGHLVKSRALENHILYNRLTDETGTASYEIDLPQGGASYVIGNIIEQSPDTSNSAIISFAREAKRNPDSALYVVANTFFNARSAGTFVAVSDTITSVTLRDNIFAGPGTVCDLASAVSDTNFVGDPLFVDAATYDFHLKIGSPAIDKGVAPGSAGSVSLNPDCQYVHPAHAVVRTLIGTLDQGGFELGGESTVACGDTISGDAGPSDGAARDATPIDDGATGDVGTDGSGNDASSGDGGRGVDGGPDGGVDDDAGDGAASSDSGGCGCRMAPSSKEGAAWSALVALGLIAMSSRRRRPLR